ncbi:CA [Mytilus edulis]|uniref:Carbonic anhydrase n=1 Tax=Mytilus edulis TaxID=6550 RepID=A0A8S3R1S7_MYTED|nr:CA [Mytilus edulis]
MMVNMVSLSGWSYEGQHGLGHWNKEYPDCGRQHQSPIDIPSNPTFNPSIFMNFNGFEKTKEFSLTLRNNGHTAVVKVDSPNHSVFVTGNQLPGIIFKTMQFHFHWGKDSSSGSEHLVKGQSFPLEMHIVNYNYLAYESIQDAMKHSDGLAVIAILFETTAEDNEDLKPLIEGLEKNSESSIDSLSLSKLLPKNTRCFYRYDGSLTTPGCFESVTWTILSQPQTISERQLNKFRALCDDHGNHLIKFNNRPTQGLHGRKYIRSATTLYNLLYNLKLSHKMSGTEVLIDDRIQLVSAIEIGPPSCRFKVLRRYLVQALRKKHPYLAANIDQVILHQDSAPGHTSL